MPQSLSMIVVHLVFSTKDRLPLIGPSVRAELHAYLSSVARNTGCEMVRVGGTEDHVHMAFRLSRTMSIAQIVEEVKKTSSKWMKGQSPTLGAFAWQRGYAVFSVGPTSEAKVWEYIDGQEKHHRAVSFQEEVRAFFKKYGVAYDERYVWD